VVNPCTGVKIKRDKSLPQFLTIDQLRTLKATPVDPHVGHAFLFACYCGLRLSDVDALRWSQIKDGILTYSQKKTGQPERIRLSGTALEILEAQKSVPPSRHTKRPHPPDSVFRLPRPQRVHIVLRQWGERAGLDFPLHFHISRHTFATMLISHGADLYVTGKLLGHSSIASTQRYAQVIDRKKDEAISLLPDLFDGKGAEAPR